YFLLRLRNQDPQFPKVGDANAKKTYLTRSLSLGQIINKYNRVLTVDEAKFKVDFGVVHIRDAFAHGRLLTTEGLPPVVEIRQREARPRQNRLQRGAHLRMAEERALAI